MTGARPEKRAGHGEARTLRLAPHDQPAHRRAGCPPRPPSGRRYRTAPLWPSLSAVTASAMRPGKRPRLPWFRTALNEKALRIRRAVSRCCRRLRLRGRPFAPHPRTGEMEFTRRLLNDDRDEDCRSLCRPRASRTLPASTSDDGLQASPAADRVLRRLRRHHRRELEALRGTHCTVSNRSRRSAAVGMAAFRPRDETRRGGAGRGSAFHRRSQETGAGGRVSASKVVPGAACGVGRAEAPSLPGASRTDRAGAAATGQAAIGSVISRSS